MIAIIFLLSTPSAGYASATAVEPWTPLQSLLIYFPLFPLFGLMLTGKYLLLRPWVLEWRARGASSGIEPGASA